MYVFYYVFYYRPGVVKNAIISLYLKYKFNKISKKMLYKIVIYE